MTTASVGLTTAGAIDCLPLNTVLLDESGHMWTRYSSGWICHCGDTFDAALILEDAVHPLRLRS